GEDPATGSAADCTAAWMVRYGIAKSGDTVHIRQGVEIKRPSQIFVRASRRDERIADVRVGGHAVEITMEVGMSGADPMAAALGQQLTTTKSNELTKPAPRAADVR